MYSCGVRAIQIAVYVTIYVVTIWTARVWQYWSPNLQQDALSGVGGGGMSDAAALGRDGVGAAKAAGVMYQWQSQPGAPARVYGWRLQSPSSLATLAASCTSFNY